MAKTNDDGTIETWLRGLAPDARTGELTVLALARALSRTEGRDTAPAIGADPGTTDAVRHVVDWLAAAVSTGQPWLSRTDASGRPLKLLKIGSLDRAVREADKAMRRSAQGSVPPMRDAGPRTVLADGWTLVRLVDPEALDRESSSMQHCLGAGAYDSKVSFGDHVYLSLRDPSDRPHATLEIHAADRRLVQIRGKQNRPPEFRYVAVLRPFLEQNVVLTSVEAVRIGLVRDVRGRLHPLDDLPDVLDAAGDLSLDLRRNGIRLPSRRVSAEGELEIRSDPSAKLALPTRLGAGGTLRLSGSFSFHPDATIEARSLILRGASLDALPVGLDVPGKLDLTDSDLRVLPAGLKAGSLVLAASKIERIPDDARIGDLDLKWTGIGTLPVGMALRSLAAEHSSLSALPDGLVVERDVRIVNSPVRSFGSGVRIGRDLLLHDVPPDLLVPSGTIVDGTLELRGFVPSAFPEGVATRSLVLRDVVRATLPDRLSIAGDLFVHSSGIGTMPSTIEVGGDVDWFSDAEIDLPHGMVVGGDATFASSKRVGFGFGTRIGGRLDVSGAADPVLADSLTVGGDLVVNPMAATRTLPDGLAVGGSLACPFALQRLPERMRVGSLDLSATKVRRLPGGLHVERDLVLCSTDVDVLPEDLVVSGMLWVPDLFDASRLPPGVEPERVRRETWEGHAILEEARMTIADLRPPTPADVFALSA